MEEKNKESNTPVQDFNETAKAVTPEIPKQSPTVETQLLMKQIELLQEQIKTLSTQVNKPKEETITPVAEFIENKFDLMKLSDHYQMTPENVVDNIYHNVKQQAYTFQKPKNLTDIEAFVTFAKDYGVPTSQIVQDIRNGIFDYS